ncbi:hypothetical protein BD560DRAFT_402186 [Blakeslea trispora]|nr:hypothetical protein BD560DRAFT_402186 [Blakeslea trispora]
MQSTDIRSNALSFEIRKRNYLIKHKKHTLSSAVNVICTKVNTSPITTTAATTDTVNAFTTSQAMWDRTNYANPRQLNTYSSTLEPTSEDDDDDESSYEERNEQSDSSKEKMVLEDTRDDLDGLSTSSLSEEEEEQMMTVTTTSSDLFQFHFEFGSKRPPQTTVDVVEHDTSEEDESYSESEDIDDWELNLDDSRFFPSATDQALQTYETSHRTSILLDNPLDACGDDNRCINRMMFMECMLQDCPCGRLCRNRRFQLGQYASVDVIKTQKKGYGLRALTNLAPNSFIMEYIGEVIPQKIIDATKRGCLARFMNHSCNPNCVTQKWVIGKKMRIGIFTNRYITAGEELTFDYKFERYGTIAQKCYCGEPNCKGYIGASDNEIQEKYVTAKLEPLQDSSTVQSFVKRMLNSVGKPRLMTNVENSHGREMLKTIVRYMVLQVLEKLPLANRNGLEDCKLFDVVEKFVDHYNEDISQLAQSLLDMWSNLKSVYRIPKRAQVEAVATESDISFDHEVTETQSESGAFESEDKHGEEEMPALEKVTCNESFKHNGSIKPNKLQFKKRGIKRKRYDSTRELFDPDNDCFEYLSMQATLEDLSLLLTHIGSIDKKKSHIPFIILHLPNIQHPYPTTPSLSHPFYNTHYTQTDLSMYMYSNYNSYYYYSQPTVSEELSEEYYNDQQTASASVLVQNPWQIATTEEGAVYYCNLVTNESQWHMPDELQASSTTTDSYIPPPPPPPAEEHVDTPPPPPPSPRSTTPIKHIKSPHHLLTPTSGSNHATEEEDDYWNDVDLKREVGKVVTKYLSSRQQGLWQGDKHLFKDLARKVTHHIVDKELQSGRKIKSMDNSLRIKIEKFIDIYGADLSIKIRQTKKL